MRLPSLHILETENKGRGVFTNQQIRADTIIEVAPVIVMPAADRVLLDQTKLHDYIFEWGDDKTECAMALGWIPVYNHSYQSNCEYYMDFDTANMLVKTVRKVNAGEELTINYNGDWNNEKPVWFDALQ
jgi:SET domain-containing protein